jgi:hypothetical protein
VALRPSVPTAGQLEEGQHSGVQHLPHLLAAEARVAALLPPADLSSEQSVPSQAVDRQRVRVAEQAVRQQAALMSFQPCWVEWWEHVV